MNELQFLKDLADEHNLKWFINERGDLEIKDHQLCFHLADMSGGELDSTARWKSYHDESIRCVFVYPPELLKANVVNVLKNILLHQCGLSKRVYARKLVVAEYPAIQLKSFFSENNIQGYRSAKKAYVLEDPITHEPYMSYTIGHSFFGKGNYDCEIARGACRLGYAVIGGASKLWKYIINNNPEINSIVYYCDRRQYDQRSISHLMDSQCMKDVGTVYQFEGGRSFINYWVNDTMYEDKLWHKAGDYKNREPNRHKAVMEAMRRGDCISIYNPGSFTNVFVRNGYHLDGLKVVKD